MVDKNLGPNPTEMQEAILRSGYLLESRTESTLIEHGYYPSLNLRYKNVDGIFREIDILATDYTNEFYSSKQNLVVRVELVIECLNNPHPVVYFDKSPDPRSFLDSIKYTGAPTHIPTKYRVRDTTGVRRMVFWESITTNAFTKNPHHYKFMPTHSQYCTFHKKDKSWIALHPDTHHSSIKNLTDATNHIIYQNLRSNAEYIQSHESNEIDSFINLVYPLVILGGPLATCSTDGEIKDSQHVKFVETRYRANKQGHNEAEVIDIIQERYLPNYLDLVYHESKSVYSYMMKRRVAVQRSARKVRKMTEGLSQDEVINVFESMPENLYD